MYDDIDPLALDIPDEIIYSNENSPTALSPEFEKRADGQLRALVFRGHKASVCSCQFIANDTKILTASNDKTIRIWDIGGNLIKVYSGHSHNITKARANLDATKFVSSSWDKHVNLWDTETAAILWTGVNTDLVTCCNFSHDGKMAVSGSDLNHVIKVWDVDTGNLIAKTTDLHTSTISSVMFSPKDDRIITTSMDMSTKVWDLKSLRNTLTLRGHANVITSASCSMDERKLATVSWDRRVQVWDVSTGMYRSAGTESIRNAHEGSISSCYFGKDATLLVTGGYDNTVALWDMENMVLRVRLQGHSSWVEDVCANKDMNKIISCGKDKTIRLWNITDSDCIPRLLENKNCVTLKILKCSSCEKPFSVAQSVIPQDNALCVFCRLQRPSLNVPQIDDPRDS